MAEDMNVRLLHRAARSPAAVEDDRRDHLTQGDEERWATDGGRTVDARNQVWATTRHVRSQQRSGFGVPEG